MKRHILRPVLVLLALAAVGGAGYYVFTLEQRASALRDAERAFNEDAVRLHATLAELRAAQAGYLATGQDTVVWIEKVLQLRQQADEQVKRLQAADAGQASGRSALAAGASRAPADDLLPGVVEALASFGGIDTRVQGVLRDEQPLTASGLIFGDAAQAIREAQNALGRSRGAHASRTGAEVARFRRQEIYAMAGAAGVVLVVLLLLVPVPRPDAAREPVAVDGEPDVARDSMADATGVSAVGAERDFNPLSGETAHAGHANLDFDLALPPRKPARPVVDLEGFQRESAGRDTGVTADDGQLGTAVPDADGHTGDDRHAGATARGTQRRPAPHGEAGAAPSAASEPAPLHGGRVPSVDLAAAARLCTDLARVHDTSELQELLARAAALLDATGIVVWMGSQEGDVLWPAFSHGYSPQSLAKMQALPRDGSTPVSMAFRKGLMEVVPAADRNSGAIVAPILTASGCVGAMAVEVPHGAERSDAAQALSSIVAAQLATLVAGETAQ